MLLIAVDQFRADYLERFAGEFTGGLKRLREQGVVFTDAHQHHAITATGPGHASISTGSFPRHSGIIGNQWYEGDGLKRMYCVEDRTSPLVTSQGVGAEGATGRSPRNLRVTALPDWIKEKNPESKVFAASRKDRAAILMGSRGADGAFWYDTETGEFLSSRYYLRELPLWLRDFNDRNLPAAYFGKLWTPRPVSEELKASMEILKPDFGWFRGGFPHAIGSDSARPDGDFYSSFGGTPFMDQYLSEMVQALVEGEQLGADEVVDYLGVSFSACDSVGHSYGPNSPEILDLVVRLDVVLGELFEFLDRKIGMEHVWVALSADHGVMELPEYMQVRYGKGHRMDDEDIQCIQNRGGDFLAEYGAEDDWFLNGFYLNYAAVGRNNLLREDVEKAAAKFLESCDFIQKVWSRTELERPSEDYFHTLFHNSFFAGRTPDLMVQTPEYYLTTQGQGTSHGSPYRYDTHVPIVFMVPQADAARIDERVATVDIAPTLADLLQLEVSEEVDGRSLRRFLEPGALTGSPAAGPQAAEASR